MSERSTQKQKVLLDFVSKFIIEHGYGPSYREVMSGLGYKSVSTVATHINGLIAKGYLRKRDNSARSLEVVSDRYQPGASVPQRQGATPSREKWIVEEISRRFIIYKYDKDQQNLDELYVLIGALKVLGFEGAYQAMKARLAEALKG